jgi:hypothetical protein
VGRRDCVQGMRRYDFKFGSIDTGAGNRLHFRNEFQFTTRQHTLEPVPLLLYTFYARAVLCTCAAA